MALAHHVLADQDDPDKGDRLRSASAPDARQGKHGGYYDGYALASSMDADSELLTAVEVLPANADEAADAAVLLASEEAAHGNRVQAVSLDGIGFRGDVLRQLGDPRGLAVTVYAGLGLVDPSAGLLPGDGLPVGPRTDGAALSWGTRNRAPQSP